MEKAEGESNDTIEIDVQCHGLDVVISKTEHLIDLLKEANLLVDKLASRKIELKVNI